PPLTPLLESCPVHLNICPLFPLDLFLPLHPSSILLPPLLDWPNAQAPPLHPPFSFSLFFLFLSFLFFPSCIYVSFPLPVSLSLSLSLSLSQLGSAHVCTR